MSPLEGRRSKQEPARSRGFELAKKIERKKMSARDENRHLDVKREINFRMSALIDRTGRITVRKKLSAGS
jgi:hypothetical protein